MKEYVLETVVREVRTKRIESPVIYVRDNDVSNTNILDEYQSNFEREVSNKLKNNEIQFDEKDIDVEVESSSFLCDSKIDEKIEEDLDKTIKEENITIEVTRTQTFYGNVTIAYTNGNEKYDKIEKITEYLKERYEDTDAIIEDEMSCCENDIDVDYNLAAKVDSDNIEQFIPNFDEQFGRPSIFDNTSYIDVFIIPKEDNYIKKIFDDKKLRERIDYILDFKEKVLLFENKEDLIKFKSNNIVSIKDRGVKENVYHKVIIIKEERKED